MPRQRKGLPETARPSRQEEADVDLAIPRKVRPGAAWAAAMVLLVAAAVPGQGTSQGNAPKLAVLHATVTITGGVHFTGTYDQRLPVQTCATVARA